MKMTIESTSETTQFSYGWGDVPVRHWKGVTENGVECHVFVHRIAVAKGGETAQFEAELREMDPPSGPRVVDLRAIL